MGGLGGGVRNLSLGRRSPDPDMKRRGQVRAPQVGKVTAHESAGEDPDPPRPRRRGKQLQAQPLGAVCDVSSTPRLPPPA